MWLFIRPSFPQGGQLLLQDNKCRSIVVWDILPTQQLHIYIGYMPNNQGKIT